MSVCVEARAGHGWRRRLVAGALAALALVAACRAGETPAMPDAGDFLAALPEALGTYDTERLRRLVDDFNRGQRQRFGQNDTDWTPPAVDYTQFTVTDYGTYFILDQRWVERGHSEGIDGGVDRHAAIVFAKFPVTEAARLEGPVYPFDNRHLILLAPAHDSCLGDLIPSGSVAVYDLRRGREIFRADLPQDTIALTKVVAIGRNAVRFTTVDESPIEGDGCEVGGRVRRHTSAVEVRCQPESDRCRLVRKTLGVVRACQTIGGCD